MIDGRPGVHGQAAAGVDALGHGLRMLALSLHDVHAPVAVEIGEGHAERARRLLAHEHVDPGREVAASVVDDQAVRATERSDHEVGVAVVVGVEIGHDVVVLADVGGRRPPRGGHVAEAALAVVAEDVLATARLVLGGEIAVVDRHQVEMAVAVEIHRLELVVVGVLRQRPRILGERAGAVVPEQAAAGTALARHEHVQVVVVVDVDQLEVPREAHPQRRHPLGRRVGEPAGAVVEPQAGHAAVVRHVVAGAPIGKDEVEVAVEVDIACLQIAEAQRHLRQAGGGDIAERASPIAQVQPALRLVGGADDDVGVPVAVQVAGLDDTGQAARIAEHPGGRVFELESGPDVEEHLVGLGCAWRRVVAAVGEQQIESAVAVQVGDLDLVGPEACRWQRLGRDIHPQRRRRLGDDGHGQYCDDCQGSTNASHPGMICERATTSAASPRGTASDPCSWGDRGTDRTP